MKLKPFVRNPYNYDVDDASNETALLCTDEHRTEQQHIEEADINYIADRFMRTGEAPQVLDLPTPGDFSGIFDFQSAMNTIAQAKEQFMSLPAKVRTRFSNDPAELLKFVNDNTNYDEAVKLGFIPPKPAGPTETTYDETRIRGSAKETPQDTTGARRAQTSEVSTGDTKKP